MRIDWLSDADAHLQGFHMDSGVQYYSIVLDRTIFHPQGGGQPSDTGTIEIIYRAEGAEDQLFKLQVMKLVNNDSVIEHVGCFVKPFEPGSTTDILALEGAEAVLKVDPDIRKLHARIHSAGHFIDLAVRLPASLRCNYVLCRSPK